MSPFLSAIQWFARKTWDVEFFINKGRQLYVSETQVALRRKHSSSSVSVSKRPISLTDLVAFHSALDLRYFERTRTWCVALFAFFGLLRIGEYCDGALLIGDVSAQPYGLEIVIRRSKTNPHPDRISLALRPDIFCPAAALRHYASVFPVLGIPSGPSDPLFAVCTRGGSRVELMRPSHFNDDIRALLRCLFPSRAASEYAGHSFRRGGTTAMLQAGVSEAIVQRHGRWRSDALKKYLDSLSSPATRIIPTQALIHAPIVVPRVH